MLMMNKLTPDQRVQKAVIDIMAHPRYAALAGVLMIGDRRVETDADKCPTAYTNGRDVVFGADFVETLNDAELRFLTLHEEAHKMYRHLTTWRWMFEENPQLANIACDHVINLQIVQECSRDKFATMTGPLEIGCYDERFTGMDAAQVYNILKQEQKNDPDGQSQGQGQGQGQGQPLDEHGWDDAQEMTEQEKRDLARDVDEALRQGALAAGKMGNGEARDMADLLEPQVDWREVLREFVQTTCAGNDYSTWRRPNRRYIGAGVYMPSGISEQIGEIVVAIDTSGSIGNRELGAFLGEIKAVADTVHPEAIRVLYWDSMVRGDERYEGDECDHIIQSTKPVGGGGTDATCVPEYIAEQQLKAQAVIMLTDGHVWGGWGEWQHPVLWCILDNKGATPSVGKTVHIKSRDM